MGSYTQASKPITTTNEFKNIYVKDICNNILSSRIQPKNGKPWKN